MFRARSAGRRKPLNADPLDGVKPMRAATIAALLFALNSWPTAAAGEAASDLWRHAPGQCQHGLHPQPGGPFSVILFCEDALGVYLGVLYFAPIRAPATQAPHRWTLHDRYWQSPDWSNVTSFAWSRDGRLFVATDQIYGDGMLYELDLMARTTKRLLPRQLAEGKLGPGYTIEAIDHERQVLRVSPGGELSVVRQPK